MCTLKPAWPSYLLIILTLSIFCICYYIYLETVLKSSVLFEMPLEHSNTSDAEGTDYVDFDKRDCDEVSITFCFSNLF